MLTVKPARGWIEAHPLTAQALKEEAKALKPIGITLKTDGISESYS